MRAQLESRVSVIEKNLFGLSSLKVSLRYLAVLGIRIRIHFSHKCVERTEIMTAKKILT